MNILAIIPARGGSKEVPKKNIRLLAGKPLVVYSIEQAKKSKYIYRIVVSTEDEEIAKIARKWNVEVIKRPQELARDDTPMVDVVIHTLEVLKEEKYIPDIIVLLQPTSPLRTHEDIDNAIQRFLETKDCSALVSITEFDHPPLWALKIDDNVLKPVFGKKYLKMRRQELSKLYRPNGAIFIIYPQVLYSERTFYPEKTTYYIMPPERSIDIDTEFDFIIAEKLMTEMFLQKRQKY